MLDKIELQPNDFEMTVADIQPGQKFVHMPTGKVGVKTLLKERNDDQRDECIDLETGGVFLAGTNQFSARDALVVIPCELLKIESV